MKNILRLIIIFIKLIPAFAYSQTNENYINVGYSSICCGTPSEKPLINFIISFEIENRLNSFEMFTEKGLGEEGEYAVYIGIDNLNDTLLKSFWEGLKKTALEQNKLRSETHDGYVNIYDDLTSRSNLESIKAEPKNNFNKLEPYNYKQ